MKYRKGIQNKGWEGQLGTQYLTENGKSLNHINKSTLEGGSTNSYN